MTKDKKLSIFYLVIYFIICFLAFYTTDLFTASILKKIEVIMFSFLGFFVCYKDIKPAKSLFSLLIIYNIYVFFTDFQEQMNILFVLLENLFFTYLGFKLITREYNIKSDHINKNNICFVFRKPKKLDENMKSIPSECACSFGMLIQGNLLQLRKGFDTVQIIGYKDKYIYDNYIVIDSGVSDNKLNASDIDKLLKQKARKPETLLFRINCLRCFKDILNKIGYGYGWRFLPCLFLRRFI